MGKIILDLCGGTGSWSKPYKDAGYEVHVISLPEFNVADWWVVGEVVRFRKQKWSKDGGEYLDIPIQDVYGILAAPPCTQFSKMRIKAKEPRDFVGGMATVNACLSIIQAVQISGHKLAFWALENPQGLLSRFLGNPPYKFEQWMFGNDRVKLTYLWGRFNNPKPKFTVRPDYVKKFGHNVLRDDMRYPTAPEEYKHLNLDRSAIRAITDGGFARAFYEANK